MKILVYHAIRRLLNSILRNSSSDFAGNITLIEGQGRHIDNNREPNHLQESCEGINVSFECKIYVDCVMENAEALLTIPMQNRMEPSNLILLSKRLSRYS